MMKDDQSPDSLEKLLSDMDSPPSDKNAKKRAMNLAMAEFNQQHNVKNSVKRNIEKNNKKNTQGFSFLPRPISNFLTASRMSIMKALNNKLFYSGVATLSVAVMGTLIFQQTYQAPIDPTSMTVDESVHLEEQPLSFAEKKKELGRESKDQARLRAEVEKRIATTAPVVSEPELFEITSDTSQIQPLVQSAAPVKNKRLNTEAGAAASVEIKADSQKLLAISSSPIQAPDILPPQGYNEEGRDKFESVEANPIKLVSEEPVSTFSIDVDTASYSFVRRQLNQGVFPQKSAVRIEEMVNYFDYNYPLAETKAEPFKPSITVQPSPWNSGKKLVHIGVKGYDIPRAEQPRSNLVLLLDVSGSMNSADKLPLVKQSMSMLLDTLHPEDTIAIAVYAGAAGQVLAPTPAKDKQTILNALNRLNAGGSTAGGQGIKLAYQLAEANFNKEAVNRIILATDGDFNVGIRNSEELKGFVERKREQGVFLSVLGFGQGNYNDQLMQALAQNGNGIAAYIDSVREAQKVLIDEATSTLFPIAKDVKIQVEFNPSTVSEYRLVGYETRHLNREDFNNDKVDAGDIGAGHTVTAIYEITPKGAGVSQSIDSLRYQDGATKAVQIDAPVSSAISEYGFVKVRYKLPTSDKSTLISQAISTDQVATKELAQEAEFAGAVAGFAQLLKGGKYLNNYGYDDVISAAQANKGADIFGYRTEFIQLVRSAKTASLIK